MAQKMPVGAVQERLRGFTETTHSYREWNQSSRLAYREDEPTYNTFDGLGWRNPVFGMS